MTTCFGTFSLCGFYVLLAMQKLMQLKKNQFCDVFHSYKTISMYSVIQNNVAKMKGQSRNSKRIENPIGALSFKRCVGPQESHRDH